MAQAGLFCSSCHRRFDEIGGIPLLVSESQSQRFHWGRLLGAFQAETHQATLALSQSLLQPRLLHKTRRRLELVRAALTSQVERIVQLFDDAGITPMAQAGDLANPIQSVPDSLLSYFTLIHRDYGWAPESNEAAQSVEDLLCVLPGGFKLGRTLVLGAGTGRLAWDLALKLEEGAPVVALDLNPLPLLVSARLLAGEEVSLFELPGHPLRSDFAAVDRRLVAPPKMPPGLQLLFADGLAPPVKNQSWDTVITPWFLDQVPDNLATLLPMVRQFLAPGGSWLHTGPFVYNPERTSPAHRYSGDEFIQLCQASSFQIEKATYEAKDYLLSPLSSQSRRETVLYMLATLGELPKSSPLLDPHWCVEEGRTISIPTSFTTQLGDAPHPMVALIARLIDGKRSTVDIVAELILSGRLEDDGSAEAAVRACLQLIAKANAASS